jgi:hypothetical protein
MKRTDDALAGVACIARVLSIAAAVMDVPAGIGHVGAGVRRVAAERIARVNARVVPNVVRDCDIAGVAPIPGDPS